MSAMLLHLASYAPNARVVTMFLHEKALELPLREITHGQNREPAFVRMNPMGQIPVLEFPDGFCLSENVAICEYLEAQNPDPPLIGADDRERAETRMWARRLDLNICEHLANITRFGLAEDYFRSHILVVPEIIPASPRWWRIGCGGWIFRWETVGRSFAANGSRSRTSSCSASLISPIRGSSRSTGAIRG